MSNISKHKSTGDTTVLGAILLGVAVLIMLIGLAFASFFSRATGDKSTGGRSYSLTDASVTSGEASGEKYSCSDVTKVPKAYMPWVKEAAKKYLGGDEALVIAIVSVENNSWNPKSISSTGAVGIGQFVAKTASQYKIKPWDPFFGMRIIKVPRADNVKYRVTKAEKESFRVKYADSGRLQPGPSIMALALHFHILMKNNNADIKNTYAKYYHTYGDDGSQKALADSVAEKLYNNYLKIKASGCK